MRTASRPHHRPALSAAAIVLALCVAGCGGSPAKPQPTTTDLNVPGERTTQLVTALGTCFLSHHLVPDQVIKRYMQYVPKKGGQFDTSSVAFHQAYDQFADQVMYNHKSMGDWVDQGVVDGTTWPTSLCGPIPSPGK